MKYQFDSKEQRLALLGGAPRRDKSNHFIIRVSCDCGNKKWIRRDHFKSGRIRSCGCLHSEMLKISTIKHGHNRNLTIGKTPTYNTWQNMKKRCLNPKTIQWKDYGGGGIKICERWLKFENFLEDMGERPSSKMSLDRINPFGNYEKSNCRWATKVEQANNTKGHYAIQILKQFKGASPSVV